MSLHHAPNFANPLRIVVADDHPTILRLVKQLIGQEPHMKVVGSAPDGATAIALAEELRPDVVVLNVVMPNMTGFEAARRIREAAPDTGIVILSTHKDEQFVKLARECGATAFVSKGQAVEELVHAIEAAGRGERLVAPLA
jgi:DNA-binding NarL/FixJ family response regulator